MWIYKLYRAVLCLYHYLPGNHFGTILDYNYDQYNSYTVTQHHQHSPALPRSPHASAVNDYTQADQYGWVWVGSADLWLTSLLSGVS